MGARPRQLFVLDKEPNRQNASGEQIAKLEYIIKKCPAMKVYVDKIPSQDELDMDKRSKQYHGALIIFDPIEQSLPLMQIIQKRPLLEVYNGRRPTERNMKNLADRNTCDGVLVTFKRLDFDEMYETE